ncbi:hypothetical protein JCM15519_12280 [Fundidesulfovibrio butyratiphilus]
MTRKIDLTRSQGLRSGRTQSANDRDQQVVRRRGPGRIRALLEDLGQSAGLAEEGLPFGDVRLLQGGGETRKIIAVSEQSYFPDSLIRQSLSLAERLGAEVAALCVRREAGQPGPAGEKSRQAWAADCDVKAAEFRALASAMEVPFRLEVGFGETSEVVEELCSKLRRVEFVLALRRESGGPRLRVSMPVFEVMAV